MAALTSPTEAAEMPSMPERVVRPSEEEYRHSSDDAEGRRPLRSSQQPVGRASIIPQPSIERASHDSPSHGQLTHWQPQHRPQYLSMNGKGHQGSFYGNSTSNDYTVYDGPGGPVPGNMASSHAPTNTYPGTEIYFQPVYRGPGNQPMSEIPSAMPSRQPSVANRPVRRAVRPQWQDDYDANLDGYDEERTPQKKGHARKRTNIYLVREGGDGGDGGSPPPEEMLRLPFTGFMEGTIKGRTYIHDPLFCHIGLLTFSRFHRRAWGIRRHNALSLLCFRRHDSCQCWSTS